MRALPTVRVSVLEAVVVNMVGLCRTCQDVLLVTWKARTRQIVSLCEIQPWSFSGTTARRHPDAAPQYVLCCSSSRLVQRLHGTRILTGSYLYSVSQR